MSAACNNHRPSFRGHRWSEAVFNEPVRSCEANPRIGVLAGEGVGPEVVACALEVLSAVESVSGRRFEITRGGAIGREAEKECGSPLSPSVVEFCEEVFSSGGAILAGPGGGRFVYDLRRRFDLFCKLSPLQPSDELANACRLRPECVRGVDILVVRENVGGIYQGQWREVPGPEGRQAEHTFVYTEAQVRRILNVAARIARTRQGRMAAVYKDSGIPAVSDLWRACARSVAAETGVPCTMVDIDLAAYQLLQHPREFDVLVAPNLCGDVLSDLGAVLLGSRGVSFSGNFAADGAAVYQTNHGAAYDLAGTDRANPMAQILSLAMLLRQSFGLDAEAELIETAVGEVWRQGLRTFDLAEPGCRVVGTREMGDRCAKTLVGLKECFAANDYRALARLPV